MIKPVNEKDSILELILKELKEIKTDVSDIKVRVTNLEKDVSEIKVKVTILEKDVADIKRCPTIQKELVELN
ncbi:MAG: hypothetical protein K2K18_01050, partial [Malacoplasma sp.]|nr:hypothetical protein [Malacoplasma sp.]